MVVAQILKRLVKKLRNSNAGILSLATLVIIALGTFGSYLAERHVNGQFSNLGDSLWWTLVTMSTVGYGDKITLTTAGRVIGSICMIGGPVLMVSFVGAVGVRLYETWTKGAKGMAQIKSKGHIVICGWKRSAEEIITELRESQMHELPITIIDDKIESKPLDIAGISFVKGNPSELRVLNRANIAEARFAIILSENGLPAADQKTVLTTLAIKKSNKSTVVCAEVNDPDNEDYLKAAGCEIIIDTRSLSSRLLAMSLQNPAVNDIVTELVSQAGNEIYREPVPARYHGRQFIDAFSDLKKMNDGIVVGIEREGRVMVNPAAAQVLNAGDILLIVSLEPPVL